LLVLAGFSSARLSGDEIYYWVDESGVANFSQTRPSEQVVGVSTMALADTSPAVNDPNEDLWSIEKTAERTLAHREELAKKREGHRAQQIAAAERSSLYPQHREPASTAIWPVSYPRRYGRSRYGHDKHGDRGNGKGSGTRPDSSRPRSESPIGINIVRPANSTD
jgi:hypothetical protein